MKVCLTQIPRDNNKLNDSTSVIASVGDVYVYANVQETTGFVKILRAKNSHYFLTYNKAGQQVKFNVLSRSTFFLGTK